MADNLKYGLYDKSEVVPGYFGSPTPATDDDRLRELGLFDDEETLVRSGLLGDIEDANKPSIAETAGDFLTGVKDTIEEPLKEVVEGGFNIIDDVKLLSEGRVDETKGLLGDFLKAGEGRIEKINEFNAAVDATGGGMFDKAIGTGLNVLGAGVDFTGDLVVSGLKTLAPEGLERATEAGLQNFLQTDFGKGTVDFIKAGGEKLDQFKETSPEANRLVLTIESLLPLAEIATGGATTKVGKEIGGEIIESGVKGAGELVEAGKDIAGKGIESLKEGATSLKESIPDISLPKSDPEAGLLKKLDLQTQKGFIDGVEVDIPNINKGVVEKLSTPFREGNTKVLAGRALSPRTVGKSAKQKLKSIQDVEKNANNFYKNIRTGVIEGDISTIENASQSVIDNIDTIGARIGEAVKKVNGTVNIDNDVTDSIITALNARGSSVSPATGILTKFLDDLGDGALSVADAFELKKAYGNEVTKLYKAGDSGTKQYKALSDGVKSINKQIDEIIDTQLGDQFANDKAVFRNLKLIVDDIVASTLVEGRRSPNTFAEQIGMIEGLLSPVDAVKQTFIKEIGELNTRGGAWKELIKIYDQKALQDFNQ